MFDVIVVVSIDTELFVFVDGGTTTVVLVVLLLITWLLVSFPVYL